MTILNVLELFRSGYDTKEIANLQGMSEAEVYNRMQAEKQHERQFGRRQEYAKRYYIEVLRPKREALAGKEAV